MVRQRPFLFLLLTLVLVACSPADDADTVDPDQGDDSMNSNIVAGQIPEDLDIRLERRDTTPLPADALIRFQAISRAKDPSNNYRWILYEDGRWFAVWHSGDTSDWQTPFDTELPSEPSATLARREVQEIEKELNKADFAGQPPYQVDPRVEGGTYYVVTVRLDGKVHEVIYDGAYPPLVEYLDGIIYTHQP
jgi:hypothetical protein